MTAQKNLFSRENVDSTVNQLSKQLFWDTAQNKIDSERNARWLIQRVLEYGQWSDWKIIEHYYGVDRIGIEMTKVRTLEPRALSFIAMLSGIPINQFRCYTRSQLNQKHWSY